jgi:hypothetical protein
VRCGFGEFCEGGFHSNASVKPNPGCVIGNCGWVIDIVRSSLVSFVIFKESRRLNRFLS